MEVRVNSDVAMEQLKLDHAQELYDLTETNREYLKEWLPWLDQIKSSDDTVKFIESTIKASSSGGAPNFSILYEGVICGVVGFHTINKQHRSGSIGYWLAQNHTGKGIITEAAKELLKIGFGELNLNKIEMHCAEGNIKSRAIPERLGFTYEATLRQCEWLYSKYVNHAVYSLLAAEYSA
ncbi:GNAT family N-acetyltransferase [Gammaproteobacteria bacterium 53_120_T64]|nr:GNAT family N-acetyltransferase [Gammaproteobacteria bacterium 53_120_T64]